MKKWIVLLVCIVALSLCACENNTDTNTRPSETQTQDAKTLAESCIDKSVQELYALIGEPASSEYAPSCRKIRR